MSFLITVLFKVFLGEDGLILFLILCNQSTIDTVMDYIFFSDTIDTLYMICSIFQPAHLWKQGGRPVVYLAVNFACWRLP